VGGSGIVEGHTQVLAGAQANALGDSLERVQSEVSSCFACPRLVAWRQGVADDPPARYRGQEYWARPIPGWGDARARLLIVGLAPAAHGGNRTGRVFTGDRSGDWLFRALHRAGFASQPHSVSLDDGLQLKDCYIAAACRCAPPDNKPLPEEMRTCRPYLERELRLLPRLQVLVGLGKIGFEAAFDACRAVGLTDLRSRPRFGHGSEALLNPNLILLGTYHPSQQNTFTGKLTEPMFDAVWSRANEIIDAN
jgi:uracil-DNA glycosylase family 4